jgi:tetratricopeptide (TPR) repeat protein
MARRFQLGSTAHDRHHPVTTLQCCSQLPLLADRRRGQADAALSYLDAANLRAPQDLDIQYHLAVALYRAGRAADARILLEKLLGSFVSFADRAEAERLMQELKRS